MRTAMENGETIRFYKNLSARLAGIPEDARALEPLATSKGCDFKVLKAAIEVNARQRSLLIEKLKRLLGSLKGREIALLGLAFKPVTDDVTEAPAVDIAHLLVAEDASLRVYDPMAMANARAVLQNVKYCSNPYEAARRSHALILLTERDEFKNLDLLRIKRLFQEPVIIDGRNVLDIAKVKALGFSYIGIGR
jgi:UDPglucose 6-dehydrogenase